MHHTTKAFLLNCRTPLDSCIVRLTSAENKTNQISFVHDFTHGIAVFYFLHLFSYKRSFAQMAMQPNVTKCEKVSIKNVNTNRLYFKALRINNPKEGMNPNYKEKCPR